MTSRCVIACCKFIEGSLHARPLEKALLTQATCVVNSSGATLTCQLSVELSGPLRLIDNSNDAHRRHATAWHRPLDLISDRKP